VTTALALRRMRHLFSGSPGAVAQPFASQRSVFEIAFTLVGVFYAANLYFTFSHLQLWSGFARSRTLDALWPVAWVELVGIATSVHIIMGLLLIGSVVAALMPGRRAARIAAFLGLFLFHALLNSFGKINHAFHGWILCAFLWIFLPDGTRATIGATRIGRQHLINGFWSAMAIQGVSYTLAGSWKVLGAIPQALRGEVHSLAPDALGSHIAHRLLQTGSESLLGGLFIEHAWLSWPSFVFVLYLQVFALWAVFRPVLHRAWGLGLISFHFMVYLSMGVIFEPPVLLMGILFLCSPFAPEWRLREMLGALPVVGGVADRIFGAVLAGAGSPREVEQGRDGAVGAHGPGDLRAPREPLSGR
jgi:hypothetical protein